ncbi:unnamed protein product [Closterium sp. NIES-53]
MLALCREHRLEHRTKHIALRYFLAREVQQRGQLRLAYVASEANTADIFTKALAPGDHQRFCTMLACIALLDWSCFAYLYPTHFASSSFLFLHIGTVAVLSVVPPVLALSCGRAAAEVAVLSAGPTSMGPPVVLPVMQHPCPSRAPSARRFLPVACPRRASVSAHRTPRARVGSLPVARPQHATVVCPSHGGPAALLPVVPAAHFLLPLLLRVQQFGRRGGGGGCWGDAGVAIEGGCTSSAPLLCFVTKPAAAAAAATPPLSRLHLLLWEEGEGVADVPQQQQLPPRLLPSHGCACCCGGSGGEGARGWRMFFV